MLWHEDKEKIFALAGDVGALSGGLGGAPRLQPLRVGKERICCWFPWGSGYGVSQKPRPAKLLPKVFCLLCLLWIVTHLFLFTPLFQQKEGQERKELCNTIWAVSKCLVLILTAPLGTETMFKRPFYSTRHSALQKKKSFVVLERKMRVAVSCTDPISSR